MFCVTFPNMHTVKGKVHYTKHKQRCVLTHEKLIKPVRTLRHFYFCFLFFDCCMYTYQPYVGKVRLAVTNIGYVSVRKRATLYKPFPEKHNV